MADMDDLIHQLAESLANPTRDEMKAKVDRLMKESKPLLQNITDRDNPSQDEEYRHITEVATIQIEYWLATDLTSILSYKLLKQIVHAMSWGVLMAAELGYAKGKREAMASMVLRGRVGKPQDDPDE